MKKIEDQATGADVAADGRASDGARAPVRDAVYRAARRRYETGRLTIAARRALLASALVACMATWLFGARSLAWLPIAFVVIGLTEWRGGALMRGGRRGVVAGFASMILPLSVLRPCCGVDAKAMGASCCVMPSACWASGAVVGLAMALLLPRVPAGRRLEAALGMIAGATAVAMTRCSMLFWGEAFGLLGGLAAGIVATGLARAWWARERATA